MPPRRTEGRPVSTRMTWPARVSLPAASAATRVSGTAPSSTTGTSVNAPFASAVVATSPSFQTAVTTASGSEVPVILAVVDQPAAVVAVSAGAVPSVVKLQAYDEAPSIGFEEVRSTVARCGPSARAGRDSV